MTNEATYSSIWYWERVPADLQKEMTFMWKFIKTRKKEFNM